MRNFFVRLICCFVPNKELRHKIRKKWSKPSLLKNTEQKLNSISNKLDSISNTMTQIIKDINTILRNVDFSNGKLVQSENRFLTLMGSDRIRSLKCNKVNFIIFSYPQAIHHPTTNNTCLNIGDYVQSVAVKNVVSTVFKNAQFIYFDRDNLLNYYQQESSDICIMQGFFPANYKWVPNKHVFPVFIGFHLGGSMEYLQQDNGSEKIFKMFYLANKDYISAKSIGCRDRRTMDFCKRLGLNAYFSRCLTLTLPKRQKTKSQTKVFISVFPNHFDAVMNLCAKNGIQNIEISTAEVNLDKYDDYESHDFMPDCEKYLEKFKNEARLVITDRIHVAAPCIAMGIPAVVIKRKDNDPRYDIFDGIVKCYSETELRNQEVDLNVSAPNIEDLKKLMIENLRLTITSEVYDDKITESDKIKIDKIRKQIAEFKIADK